MIDVDVYVNEQKQAQHLAVQNEHATEMQFRSLCGASVAGLETAQVNPSAVKVACKECEHQRQMWVEVHAE